MCCQNFWMINFQPFPCTDQKSKKGNAHTPPLLVINVKKKMNGTNSRNDIRKGKTIEEMKILAQDGKK